MSKWEDFELECTEFLSNQFGDYAKFIHQGGSDSTIPDIKVITNKSKQFYIEAKHSPAQCGQFVLLPNIVEKKFDYSRLNTTPINDNSKIIIDYMNEHFEDFKDAGTAGKDIVFENCDKIFENWIVDTYKSKNVKFFITNNYKILSINDFSQYFKVTAKYRVKRSGSSSVGYANLKNIEDFIVKNFDVSSVEIKGDKLFVNSNINLHNTRFYFGNNEYMFSLRGDKYEVRKLSNTFNANVIFSIELKSNIDGMPVSDFIFVLVND